MNQNGGLQSLYGICATAFLTICAHIAERVAPLLTIISQVKLTDVLTVCAILAALTTVAVNVKNFFKKQK